MSVYRTIGPLFFFLFQMLDIYLESLDFTLPDDVTFQTMCVK